MYDNSVRLIGFVGKDAELKTTKTQREYTVLSVATTASWKDKNGDGYIRRTEWHRLIAWGNLSTFAATLKKGAHVSVEGELRYWEIIPKKQKKQKKPRVDNQGGQSPSGLPRHVEGRSWAFFHSFSSSL